MMRLILGSQSPRRREILDFFSIPYEQISSNFDEASVPFKGDPAQYAEEIATGKAATLSEMYPDATILTADTVVYKEGSCYGKPLDDQDAFRMLSELSGGWHSVFSAVVLKQGAWQKALVEETRVLFNDLTPDQIKTYLQALHWADKAGGYAIQLTGSLIVRRIEGCYYNVMGLPINSLRSLLENKGIDLWAYLK